jgi:ABC-2 type transport system permease protein
MIMNEKELTRTAFWAMVRRDLLVQWRDKGEFVFRVCMLPFILILVYGFMLPSVGILPESFPTHMFCGMIGMSMLITGIHGTAVPVSMDFHNLREIEDRLLAPVSTRTVAYSKMFVGILESFVGGLIVLPISLIFMGTKISIRMTPAEIPLLALVLILTSMASATLGLLVGTVVKPMQVAAMFPGFLMPVVFLGGIFYTWNQLAPLPVMQVITLLDPLTWINEAIRGIMTPQITSLPLAVTITGIVIWILIMGAAALRRFDRMVYNH